MKNVKVGCLGYLKVHHHPVHLQEKSLKMKGDVGMACQKVHKQGKIKVMVSIQSPIPTSLLLCEKMLGWMKLCILTITFIFPCLCTFWHAIPTSHFIFNDFSFLSYIQVHAAESKSCNIENLQSLFTFLNLIFQSFGFCPKSLVMRI